MTLTAAFPKLLRREAELAPANENAYRPEARSRIAFRERNRTFSFRHYNLTNVTAEKVPLRQTEDPTSQDRYVLSHDITCFLRDRSKTDDVRSGAFRNCRPL